MIKLTGAGTGESRLVQRLRAVADVLLDAPSFDDNHGDDAEPLLDALIRDVQVNPGLDRIWLLCVGVFGVYPTGDDVTATARTLELSSPSEARSWLLDRAAITHEALTALRHRIEIEKAREQRGARETIANRYLWKSTSFVRGRAAVVQVARRAPWIIGPVRAARARVVAARDRGAGMRLALRDRFIWRLGPPGPAGITTELPGWQGGELRVLTGGVLVDVDHSARFDLHTGIQLVVRCTVPIWARHHLLHPVAWTDDRTGWRDLERGGAAPGVPPRRSPRCGRPRAGRAGADRPLARGGRAG